MDETNAQNGVHLRKMVVENVVELREFSDEIYDRFGEAALESFQGNP